MILNDTVRLNTVIGWVLSFVKLSVPVKMIKFIHVWKCASSKTLVILLK